MNSELKVDYASTQARDLCESDSRLTKEFLGRFRPSSRYGFTKKDIELIKYQRSFYDE